MTEPTQPGLTWRSLGLGLAMVGLVCEWVHQAELVVGQRGHSALANTSIPLGAFCGLLVVVAGNALVRRFTPRRALSQAELIVIYVMMTTGTVIASSGGIHFLVPALMAPRYFATPENRWALLHPFIPWWFAPTDPLAIKQFYEGHATVPLRVWIVPILTWTFFLFTFLFATLCTNVLLRRQWVERERLTFPTVVLPLEATRPEGSLFKNRLLWIGFAIPFLIGTVNTLHTNFPAVPLIQVRAYELGPYLVNPPWNAMGRVAISFYPFIIGIAFLLSLEVTFSCWFFFLLTKVEMVLGGLLGFREAGAAAGLNRFPFTGHQGAGAFIGLVLFSLWAGRGALREAWQTAWARRTRRGEAAPDAGEPLSYRAAWLGLAGSLGALVLFCSQAGLAARVAGIVLGLSLVYMIAATRVRAESGNAWLFGPMIDPHTLVTTTLGTEVFTARDLTIMGYLRSISTFDLRCLSMPHQLDGFKMADVLNIQPRRMAMAILIAIGFAIPVAMLLALFIWYDYGALGKAEPWRTLMGKRPFEDAMAALLQPTEPDRLGLWFIGGGLVFTLLLVRMRAMFIAFPLHPVGYAIAGTNTIDTTWMPFLLAWLAKSLLLRYGGMRLYRAALPFFLGLILGDFCNGGLYTLLSCFIPMNVYPINW